MQVSKVGNAYTSVADVACLDGFEGMREEDGRVFVAGIGVEVWRAGGKERVVGGQGGGGSTLGGEIVGVGDVLQIR